METYNRIYIYNILSGCERSPSSFAKSLPEKHKTVGVVKWSFINDILDKYNNELKRGGVARN